MSRFKQKEKKQFLVCVIILIALIVVNLIIRAIKPFIMGVVEFDDYCVFYEENNEARVMVKANCDGDFVYPERFLFRNITSGSIGLDCNKLTTITINSRMAHFAISMGDLASCTGLESFFVHTDNPYLCAKEGVLFSKDGKRLIAYPTAKQGDVYVLQEGVEEIESIYSIANAINLRRLIIQGDSVVNIRRSNETVEAGTRFLQNSVGIYVPENLVEQYKSAEIWKDFADRIFPIAE